MSFRKIICVIFILCMVDCVYSQNTSINLDLKNDETSFAVSFFGGVSLLGPREDLKSNLTKSGFNDTSSGMFGVSNHPRADMLPIYRVEGTYYYSVKSGISFHWGLSDDLDVFGFKEPVFHTIFNSKIQEIGIKYVFRLKESRSDVFVGPVYLTHSLDGFSSMVKSSEIKNEKLGVYVGYNYYWLNKKHFFIAIRGDFRWAPSIEIESIPITYFDISSEILSTKVNLSTFNIGLSFGIRI